MHNIQLHFSYPWLLLLLIPALFFTLLSYFRLNKRYRCTRNNVISIVLHICIMFFAIFTLSGFVVKYQTPNEKNEIILLVDKSHSEDESSDDVDDFVETIIREGKYDGFKVGIVKFGFDQKYVVPLTVDLDDVFNNYLASDDPDVTATNIASALTYTQSLFENPKSGKIILVTDGRETDEEADKVIRDITSSGISVDVALVPSEYSGNDTQIVGITMPDYHIDVGVPCDIFVTLQSKAEQDLILTLTDNGEDKLGKRVSVKAGEQSERFNYTFTEGDLHEIKFTISSLEEDALDQNNVYCTYHYIEQFNRVLIINRNADESKILETMINSDPEEPYDVTTISVTDKDFPNDVTMLREYDQIILNNIANKDMPEGFVAALEEYVSIYGGGLFTVGGNGDDGKANAYNPEDMYGTLYQKMLPVQAINYTPPVGVMIILDRSGSMNDYDDKGNSYFDGAKAGAIAALDTLTERDFIGVMTLDEYPEVILPLTSRTQEKEIKEAISSLEMANDGKKTVFSNALVHAGNALNSYKDKVAARHIIIITDGQPTDPKTTYQPKVEELKQMGITVSIVGIDQMSNPDMEETAIIGDGKFYPVPDVKTLYTAIGDDLKGPNIKDVNDEKFKPLVNDFSSPVVNNLEMGTGEDRNYLTVELGGFYGAKIRKEATLILSGSYNVPIYAQWKYGKGTVGSFMCDLQGSEWSKVFVENDNGKTFVRNVIKSLMPTEDIEPKDINLSLKEDNYTNTISVLSDLKQGEKIVGDIIMISEEGEKTISLNEVTDLSQIEGKSTCYVTMALASENQYSRCDFIVKSMGIYKIVLRKVNADGEELCQEVFYKSFSYSEEYDSYIEETNEERDARLAGLATKGDGILIEDLEDVSSIFDQFDKFIDCVYDPRFVFMILAIVLFLADIAVRKFKFKWLHEIIRDRKRK